MQHKISLRFSKISCDRCGGERLMTEACPDCGLRPRPHEVQPDLDRRRRILAEFEATAPSEPGMVPTDLDSATNEVPELMERVTRALAAAARGGHSARDIVEAFARLDARVAYWSRRHPRPETNRARSLGRSLHLLREGLGVFATALSASNMVEAQARESEGQRLIDAAVAEIATLREIDQSEELLGAPNAFGLIGASARQAGGGDVALAKLDERLRQLAGRSEDPSSLGLGLNLHVFRHIMLVALDLDECLEVARFAENLIGDLSAVCNDPRWQARQGVVTAQFSTAAFNLSRIDEANDLEAAAAALQLVMQCRDGVVRHCLATMAATDAGDFETLTLRGSGAVIKSAARQYPELRLDENLSQLLRHAGAHYDYDIVDDHFVTRDSAGADVSLTVEEFLDQVLGYLQTSVSLLLAVTAAIATQGLDLEVSRHTPERDLLAVMTMLVGFTGFVEPSVTRQGEVLRIAAQGDAGILAVAVAGIAAIAPDNVHEVFARVTETDGSIRTWQAPIGPFHDYLQRPEGGSAVEETIALSRVMSVVRLDSEPLWDADTWSAISMQALSAVTDLPFRERVQLITELRDLARTNGQAEVAETLTHVLQVIRQGSTDAVAVPSAFVRQSIR